jgi:hypothetical protein
MYTLLYLLTTHVHTYRGNISICIKPFQLLTVHVYTHVGNVTVTRSMQEKASKFTLDLLGDSMFLDAYEKYDMVGVLHRMLPYYNLSIIGMYNVYLYVCVYILMCMYTYVHI